MPVDIMLSSAQSLASMTSTVLPTETFATVTMTSDLAAMSARQSTSPSTVLDASNTTSSTVSTSTEQTPPGLFPAATPSSSEHIRDESVFNYYFLFLITFAVLIAALLWWLHKQRKRRKEQMRLSGHNALSRDLEGWVGARRFMHGRYRGNQAAFRRREEGLDEHGEAPPPYQSKNEVSVSHDPTPAAPTSNDPIVPLRVLTREGVGGAPPGYDATNLQDEDTGARPSPRGR
ncbi:hypothetical protein FB567DRAFT_173053 [Paraphoma chrysanthemicola]|uniref:Uncharacterized protein n=1 Tax=Paraphoma chrysanthemicola TaxID=798071 RepID=A0A8K0RI99_9PLEO|nr:hypothetical protein FB567DRAFT_173053 [Paraphoma chrysanthemicola]